MNHTLERHEIVRIDSKGRLTIPSHMREELAMREGSYAAIRMNSEERTISVSVFAGAQAKLLEIRLKIPDRPGALARAARTLSELKLDLLYSSSSTLKKGELAEWIVVADSVDAGKTPEEIRRRILENKDATVVEIKELSG
jgi:AbrB family looped-hinge helix DNA binding protein